MRLTIRKYMLIVALVACVLATTSVRLTGWRGVWVGFASALGWDITFGAYYDPDKKSCNMVFWNDGIPVYGAEVWTFQ